MADYILAMATTIQVSEELLQELKNRKLYEKESYEEVIWNLMEDSMEINEETKQDIEISLKEFKEGKSKTLEQLKKERGL
ncbi:MAG: hypothetical protein AABX39_04595 [Nanoarchaeota archaeon]